VVEAIHLQLLPATFAGWVTRQQAQVISYLIEEDRVLMKRTMRIRTANAARLRACRKSELKPLWR
jgi:hypothetical protein